MDEHGASGASALAGELTPSGHRLQARVYYADTDFSGLVYHARYLEFFERGRSDFLRLSGIRHSELAARGEGEALVWVVRRMEIEFRAPARMDDVLTVETRVVEIAGARIRMAQRLSRGDRLLVEAAVEVAIVGGGGKPKRLPPQIARAILANSGAGTDPGSVTLP